MVQGNYDQGPVDMFDLDFSSYIGAVKGVLIMAYGTDIGDVSAAEGGLVNMMQGMETTSTPVEYTPTVMASATDGTTYQGAQDEYTATPIVTAEAEEPANDFGPSGGAESGDARDGNPNDGDPTPNQN